MRNRRVVSVASEIVRILESGLATEVQSARLTAFLVAENASSLIAAIIGIMRVVPPLVIVLAFPASPDSRGLKGKDRRGLILQLDPARYRFILAQSVGK